MGLFKTIKKVGKVVGKLAKGDVLGAVGTVVGGVIGSKSSKKASKAQIAAQQAAIDEQRRQFDIIQQQQEPWRKTGVSALQRLGALYGIGEDGKPTGAPADFSQFTSSPDYQFNLSEGLKAVEGGAAARGGLYSGNAMRALQERGAGIASRQLDSYTARLASLAGVGQSATSQLGQFGMQTAGNVGSLLGAQGDARASGIVGSTNAIGGAINTLGQMAGDGAFSGILKKKPKATDRLALNYIQPTLQRQV